MKKLSIIVLSILLTFSLSGCVHINDRASELEKNKSSSSVVVSSSEPEKVEPITIDFLAVGDNLIHNGVYLDAKNAGNGVYDFTKTYANVAKIIKDADVSSINQETMIAKSFPPSSYPLFNSPVELGEHMVGLGFDVFNLANNHMLDKWEKGLLETADFFDENKKLYTGVYRDEDSITPKVIKSKGIKLGFVGATESLNGLSLPAGADAVLSLSTDEEFLKKQVIDAKKKSDVVIVNIHWGIEYTHVPTDRQKELAKKLGDWGADIVIGHHPHVIQPMEYITNEDGSKTFVIYSLGNFISAQNKAATMIGGMVNIPITKEVDGTFTFDGAEFIPVVTHYDSGFKNIAVYPFSDYSEELAAKHGVRGYDAKFSYEYIGNVVKDVIGE